MTLHKVVENDIVLSEIFELAKGVGFDELRVCLGPLHPLVVDYQDYSEFPSKESVVRSYLEVTDWRVKNYPIFFLKKRRCRGP